MCQVIAHFLGRTHVLSAGSGRAVRALLATLLPSGAATSRPILILRDGRVLRDEDCLHGEYAVVRASIAGLVGGKGGFGAMLKAQSKQKGAKKTTDFGACRDLSGRRLRHVNDEQILLKWKEAKDAGKELDTEERTKSGIDLWFLDIPSWADGSKKDHRRKFMAPRRKTSLCKDWLRAREKRGAPAGAPAAWGCPRGDRCEFAHGDDELRGDAAVGRKREKEDDSKAIELQRKEAYLGVLDSLGSMDDSVMAGLRVIKKLKPSPSEESPLPLPPAEASASEDERKADEGESLTVVAEEEEDISDALFTLAGAVSIREGALRAEEAYAFSSVMVLSRATLDTPLSSLAVYYEVEVLSPGILQLGWVDKKFPLQFSSADAEDNGVGDDEHSWAYDGCRGLKWHGAEDVYGGRWQVGDIVGCEMRVSASSLCELAYYVNGVELGVAFSVPHLTVAPSAVLEGQCYELLFPALSIDGSEKAALNIGQNPFRFDEKLKASKERGFFSVKDVLAERSPSKETTVSAVSSSTAGAAAIGAALVPVSDAAIAPREALSEYPVVDLEEGTVFAADASSEAALLALEGLGLHHLKHELSRRGLKCGGTLRERALRLLGVRKQRE